MGRAVGKARALRRAARPSPRIRVGKQVSSITSSGLQPSSGWLRRHRECEVRIDAIAGSSGNDKELTCVSDDRLHIQVGARREA